VIRALVVEDERHAREALIEMLEATGEVEVVAACPHALEALREARIHRPEVIFLDIQLPRINGFQFLELLDLEVFPDVVFVTAYDNFAIRAFDESALDYLLKPVQAERLGQTLEKLKHHRKGRSRPVIPPSAIERVPCAWGQGWKLVELSEIVCVRSGPAGVYVLTGEHEYFTELTLVHLEASTRLVRTHKQFLVNPGHIEGVDSDDPRGLVLRLKNGLNVPVSRRFRPSVKAVLGL